jgi:hypothetical protein
MNLKGTGWEGIGWIYVARDRDLSGYGLDDRAIEVRYPTEAK